MNRDWRRATVPPRPGRAAALSSESREAYARAHDLVCADLPACPRCGDLQHPTATRCEACCAPLYPRQTTAPARTTLDGKREQGPTGGSMAPPNCTCHGAGICTACVLASYENDPYSRSVDLFLAAQQPPVTEPNVIPLRTPQRRAV